MALNLKDTIFDLLMRGYSKVFSKKRWYALNRLILNLALRGLGVLPDDRPGSISPGEALFLRLLASQWGQNPTIIDVGAHHGEYALEVHTLAPGARIYAFEPNPTAFQVLERNAAAYGLVPLNLGCGDRKAALPLYDYAEAAGSVHASLYHEVITFLHKGHSNATRINIIPLAEFIEERGIANVDLVKIDTEGHELMVLAGLQPMLANNQIDVVQFEFNAMNVISRSFFKDFYQALPHYDLYRILPDGLVALGDYQPLLCEYFARQNIVGVRKGCGITC